MFTNLYHYDSYFFDFNKTKFFPVISTVSGDEVARIIYAALADHDVEPANLEIFQTTLSPSCCAAFFRTYPDVPAVNRDYYLSKLFQFWYTVLMHALPNHDDPAPILESALDKIPSDLLPSLGSRFDIRNIVLFVTADGFDINSLDLQKILSACNLRRKRQMTPGRAGRTHPNKRLALKRGELFKKFADLNGTTKELCHRLKGMDRSQVSLWKTGKLPDSSRTTKRIEAGIEEWFRERNVGGR